MGRGMTISGYALCFFAELPPELSHLRGGPEWQSTSWRALGQAVSAARRGTEPGEGGRTPLTATVM